MKKHNYDDIYVVNHIKTYKEFVEYIYYEYSNCIAFRNKNGAYTYMDVAENIRRIVYSLSKYKRQCFLIDIKEPFYFTVAYFAVVISGNIALLIDNDELELIGINDDYTVIDQQNIFYYIGDKKVDVFPSVSPNEFCTLVCSSGTTSQKKGVMLSQRNLLSDMIGGMELYEYTRGSIYLNILPYTHLFGLVADLMGPLYSGGTICSSENKYQFFDDLRYFQPTTLNLPPAMVYMIYNILKETGDFAYSTGGKLKKVMCAGARLDENVNKIFDKYNMRVYVAYGLTECSPCVSMSSERFYKYNSVGKILPCCDVKIYDEEIYVSGSIVMMGYYGALCDTQNILKDGWLATGDLGYIDQDDFLFLTGRKNNLIVWDSGLKMQPEPYEQCILNIEGVREVLILQSSENPSKFEVQLFVDKEKCAFIECKVKEVFKGTKYYSYLGGIHFRESEFIKNKLGKIVRDSNYLADII